MFRKFCWFQRALRTGPAAWSKIHCFPAGSFTALCGQALPMIHRGLMAGSPAVRLCGLIEVTAEARTPASGCRRCEQYAKKFS